MTKFTQRQLRNMIANGTAVDVTNTQSRSEIPEPYKQVGYSCGTYGCNGMLFQGLETYKLYALVGYVKAIYILG